MTGAVDTENTVVESGMIVMLEAIGSLAPLDERLREASKGAV
jgi:hypothetical protein